MRPESAQADVRADKSAQFKGESMVHLSNPTAILEDAAEELSFAQSEKVETKLSKRKLEKTGSLKTLAAEQAQKYLEQVPDLERQQKLEDFARKVLRDKRDGRQSGDDLRHEAEQFSDDVTHQFLALQYLREEAVRQGAPAELLNAIQDAAAGLENDQGPAIVAGLNVSRAAREFAPEGTDNLDPLRDLYRDVVLDYSSIEDAYEKLTAADAGKDFKTSVNFLLKGLGADLGSGNSSLSGVRLKAIMDDMDKLKSLTTLYDDCADLLHRVQNRVGEGNAAGVTSEDLMGTLLQAQSHGWQGSSFFSALPDKFHIAKGEPEIYFLQGFKEVMRSMPTKAFDGDLAKRERLLQSVQEAVDTAIDEEWSDDA